MRRDTARVNVQVERRREMPTLAANLEGSQATSPPRRQRLVVYTVDLGSAVPAYPFGRETFTVRGDAEQFIEDLRRDDPEVAAKLRIEEHELTTAVHT